MFQKPGSRDSPGMTEANKPIRYTHSFLMSALRSDATGDADQYERNRELSMVRIRVLASEMSMLSRGKSGHEA